MDASIVNYLSEQGINPVAEWLKILKRKYRFIVSIDWDRPEVRKLVSTSGVECIPVDNQKLCNPCRRVTRSATATVCAHCKSPDIHRYVEVVPSSRTTAVGWAMLTEFAYPKLRSAEIIGEVSHKLTVHLKPPDPNLPGDTKDVIEIEQERNMIGESRDRNVRA
jgi:hypothetical protein